MYWSMENVPWTNMHDLNLDWIVNTMKQTVEQWIAYRIEMNQRYADFTEQINSDFDNFTEQINNDFDDFTTQINTWKSLIETEFSDLQTYVQDYFDNLDLNESTRYVINRMIASGEFIQVLNPSIVSATETWLASHVTPTSPVVDNTLTISGAAADAKITGDKFTEERQSMYSLLNNLYTKTTYTLNLGNGNIDSTTGENTSFHSAERVRCSMFEIDNSTPLYINVPEGYQVSIYEYETPTTFRLYSNEWFQHDVIYSAQYNYIRLVFSNIDTSQQITPQNLDGLEVFQFINTKEQPRIDYLWNNLFYKSAYALNLGNGNIDSETGQNISFHSAERVRCSMFEIDNSMPLYINVPEGYQVAIYEYETPTTFRLYSDEWFQHDVIYSAQYNYIRLVFSNIDTSQQITPEDLNGLEVFQYYDIIDKVATYNKYYTLDLENGNIDSSTGIDSTRSKNARVRCSAFKADPNYTLKASIPAGFQMTIYEYNEDWSFKKYNNQWVTGDIDYQISNPVIRFVFARTDLSVLTPADLTDVAIYQTIDKKYPVITEQTSWLAIGDSITFGVYSTGPGTNVGGHNGWAQQLADAFGYSLTNFGIRGMGYVAVGNNNISWNDTLTDVENLVGEYNLITIALGINDYNTENITLNQIESALDNGISRIITKFPESRVVFITPFNSNRRGTPETNYCYNYSFSGRTLKNVADLIKNKCESYGVECLYLTNGFLFNNFNMATLLPDSTHPSLKGHTLIAKNISHYLAF